MKTLLAFILACLAPLAHAQTTQPIRFGPSVWAQPASKFAYWKSAGIVTLFGCPLSADGTMSADNLTPAQWCDAADKAGLTYWLPYNKTTAPLIQRFGCLGAILQPDEPNSGGWQSPGWCQDEYRQIKQVSTKPVILNLDGAALRYPGSMYQTDADVIGYGAACDVIAYDVYPINRGEGAAAIPQVGMVAARLAKLLPGKPILAAIDTSNQMLSLSPWLSDPVMLLQRNAARGPTALEVQQEITAAMSNGAVGVFYFPDQIGAGWLAFDGTPSDVLAAIKTINAGLNAPPVAQPAVARPTTQPRSVIIDGIQYLPAK